VVERISRVESSRDETRRRTAGGRGRERCGEGEKKDWTGTTGVPGEEELPTPTLIEERRTWALGCLEA